MEFKKENYFTKHEDNVIETMSLEELKNTVDYFVKTANMNKIRFIIRIFDTFICVCRFFCVPLRSQR